MLIFAVRDETYVCVTHNFSIKYVVKQHPRVFRSSRATVELSSLSDIIMICSQV